MGIAMGTHIQRPMNVQVQILQLHSQNVIAQLSGSFSPLIRALYHQQSWHLGIRLMHNRHLIKVDFKRLEIL